MCSDGTCLLHPDKTILLSFMITAPTCLHQSELLSALFSAWEIKLFENPREKLHLENPNFFRNGQTEWERSSQWTEELESLFIALHGDLLLRFNYIGSSEYEIALEKSGAMAVQLCKLASRGFSERNWKQASRDSKQDYAGQASGVFRRDDSLGSAIHQKSRSNRQSAYWGWYSEIRRKNWNCPFQPL